MYIIYKYIPGVQMVFNTPAVHFNNDVLTVHY